MRRLTLLRARLVPTLDVINLGTVVEAEVLNGVSNEILGPGTANFCEQPAMTEEQLTRALQVGREVAERAHKKPD